MDDESVNSKMVEVALKRAGMTVMCASDGADAVNIMTKVLCDEMKVDLILMDMYMKHMNGDVATLKIRELEAAAQRSPVPIIALSGGGIGPAGTSDCETVYKAGMQGLVLNCEASIWQLYIVSKKSCIGILHSKYTRVLIFQKFLSGLVLKPLSVRSFPGTIAQCMFYFSSAVPKVDMAARMANPSKYRQSIVGDCTIME